VHQFFIEEDTDVGERVTIRNEEAHHLANVLRLRQGDKIVLARAETGQRFEAVLEHVEKETSNVRVVSILPSGEPEIELILLQGITKSDKFDFITQKSTELGVCTIIPVIMDRSVAKVKPQKAGKRVERWQRIAREAAKQCGRARPPKIEEPKTLQNALSHLPKDIFLIVPWENEQTVSVGGVLKRYHAGQTVVVIIGPEGGLTTAEVALVQEHGGYPVSLGQRILRTETAALAAVTIILHRLGDLGSEKID